MTQEFIHRIIEAIKAERETKFDSDKSHAVALDMNVAIYNQIKNGDTDKKLSEKRWQALAGRYGIKEGRTYSWKPANTETFEYITEQLTDCQERQLSVLLCDMPNIGKTFAAKYYADSHEQAVYVDCSQCKSKRRLVRTIAQAFGVRVEGRYEDFYNMLIAHLRGLSHPLIILDEAGDLSTDAFVEIKALWNATEGCCGWYMMGADGLQAKIERAIENRKVGFAEILSRFGDTARRITPVDGKERETFLLGQVVDVARVNAPHGTDALKLARKSGGLRRIHHEIEKMNLQNADSL